MESIKALVVVLCVSGCGLTPDPATGDRDLQAQIDLLNKKNDGLQQTVDTLSMLLGKVIAIQPTRPHWVVSATGEDLGEYVGNNMTRTAIDPTQPNTLFFVNRAYNPPARYSGVNCDGDAIDSSELWGGAYYPFLDGTLALVGAPVVSFQSRSRSVYLGTDQPQGCEQIAEKRSGRILIKTAFPGRVYTSQEIDWENR